MIIYQYPKCSTCRKAIKFLQENDVQFESIDITVQPPSEQQLQAMLSSYQGDIRKLFNTSGVQYRELKMKDKLPSMNAQQAIELLAGNGKLIKRPFILNKQDQGLVGFKQEQWQDFI
jgi:Spx/MgsR family transcriptional regulator